ncbi:MAG: radical SAM protein [Candidatus Bathyarchaeota archaeon]|nr:MAG: radical SAM protein [Candidatus Bathyarchaeota archaeon]
MFSKPDAAAVLKNKNVRASLARYLNVMQNDNSAKFTVAQNLAADFHTDDSLSELWKKHDQLLLTYVHLEEKMDACLKSPKTSAEPSQSFLDLKIGIANRILANCHFCARNCGVNRKEGKFGYCRCGAQITVSTMFPHMGEEPELVPSGTIFTLGCTMRCRHCQNWTISQWQDSGEIYSPKRLARAVEYLRKKGCRNVNLVGGDPTPWLAQWLETFKHVDVNVPVVWNSNSYYSPQTSKLLAGFADVYLLDFKYGNNECAKRISEAPNYWETCTHNHSYGKKYGELLIRILVLPGHLDCCVKPILEWTSKNLGPTTRTNVMFQYRPEWLAHEIPELRRRLTQSEKETAIKLAKELGLVNVIV